MRPMKQMNIAANTLQSCYCPKTYNHHNEKPQSHGTGFGVEQQNKLNYTNLFFTVLARRYLLFLVCCASSFIFIFSCFFAFISVLGAFKVFPRAMISKFLNELLSIVHQDGIR